MLPGGGPPSPTTRSKASDSSTPAPTHARHEASRPRVAPARAGRCGSTNGAREETMPAALRGVNPVAPCRANTFLRACVCVWQPAAGTGGELLGSRGWPVRDRLVFCVGLAVARRSGVWGRVREEQGLAATERTGLDTSAGRRGKARDGDRGRGSGSPDSCRREPVRRPRRPYRTRRPWPRCRRRASWLPSTGSTASSLASPLRPTTRCAR